MKKRFLAPALILLSAMIGCTKDPVNNLGEDESRIFITNRNPNIDFSSYTTFRVADSVAVIEDNQLVAREQTAFDIQLINAFTSQMEQKGFVQTDNSNPDLGITVSRIYSNSVGIVDYGSYGGYYGDYWDPYYWGYPGYSYYYPSFYGIYTITEGAVAVDMFDLKNAAANNKLDYVWNGLIRGAGTFNQSKTETNVQALFEQSPYLKKN